MTVYLITRGHHLDFHVCCIVSTLDRAIEARDLYAGPPSSRWHNCTTFTQWDVDDLPEHPQETFRWSVHISRDGDVTWAGVVDPDEDDMPRFFGRELDMCEMALWARNEEEARRVAAERRVILLALGNWPKVCDAE